MHTQIIKGNDAPSTTPNVALQGAKLAFGKPPIKPKPRLYANNKASGVRPEAITPRGKVSLPDTLSPTWIIAQTLRSNHRETGSSTASESYANDGYGTTSDSRKNNQLNQGGTARPARLDLTKSPSYIAATLTSSRSMPNSPNHTGQKFSAPRELRRQQSSSQLRNGMSDARCIVEDKGWRLGEESIHPTHSLIENFEQHVTPSKISQQTAKRAIERERRRRTTTESKAPSASNSQISTKSPSLSRRDGVIVGLGISGKVMTAGPRGHSIPSSFSSQIPSVTPRSPPTSSEYQSPQNYDDGFSSDDSFVSASSHSRKPSLRVEMAHTRPTATYTLEDVDSLANAIVASSLASSRQPSPARPSPHFRQPPQPRTNIFRYNKQFSRTPSPPRLNGLRTTMRKAKAEDEVDESDRKRGIKLIMKKHPHKHHEGDRRRWRDEVTEGERRRYEAVWASNKGLYTISQNRARLVPGAETSICNLIAKDIFKRSKLHNDILEEVYTLVDRKEDGMLIKEEFVVGLWLIDQRLKGRKLPIRVSDSVWRSVGILGMGGRGS